MEIIISKSTNKNKKFDAFVDGKKISFGHDGASDYTIHKDETRKERYIARHKKMKIGINQESKLPDIGQNIYFGIWILYRNQLMILVKNIT